MEADDLLFEILKDIRFYAVQIESEGFKFKESYPERSTNYFSQAYAIYELEDQLEKKFNKILKD